MRILSYWAPVVVWAAMIWSFSTEAFASESTSRFLRPLLAWLMPWASDAMLDTAHLAVRKMGHVAEYFLLALLLYRALAAGHGGWERRWALAAFLLATGYAVADELHQVFLPARTGSVGDVLLDAAGAAAALAVVRWRLGPAEAKRGSAASAGAEKTPTEG
jgi:VanZ family protein